MPVCMPFIPSNDVVLKMILKTAQFSSPEETRDLLNPGERKRIINEYDLNEPFYGPFDQMRVKPKTIKYPNFLDDDFWE